MYLKNIINKKNIKNCIDSKENKVIIESLKKQLFEKDQQITTLTADQEKLLTENNYLKSELQKCQKTIDELLQNKEIGFKTCGGSTSVITPGCNNLSFVEIPNTTSGTVSPPSIDIVIHNNYTINHNHIVYQNNVINNSIQQNNFIMINVILFFLIIKLILYLHHFQKLKLI